MPQPAYNDALVWFFGEGWVCLVALEMLKLNYREYGESDLPKLVILHGLLGSSRNWQAAAQSLSERFHVYCLDARNHGDSPHTERHTFDLLVDDLSGFLEEHVAGPVDLMGHSMGGKTCMRYACLYPERVKRLWVLDIAPREYPPHHDEEFMGMNALDLSKVTSRRDAEVFLENYVSSWKMRQFLITNLERGESGFEWKINLDALTRDLRLLGRNPLEATDGFEGETHFLIGGKSSFVREEDHAVIRHHFPEATLDILPEVGHNVHFEDKDAFLEWVKGYA